VKEDTPKQRAKAFISCVTAAPNKNEGPENSLHTMQ
jgi:hypothetical protein